LHFRRPKHPGMSSGCSTQRKSLMQAVPAGFYKYWELTRDGVMLAAGHLVCRAEW
jgi:hypothetical protein